MKRILFALVTAFASACASNLPASHFETRLACSATAAQNPPAHRARDSANLSGPAVRNPPAGLIRGTLRGAAGSGRVGNPSAPAVARGDRGPECALTLAHAGR
jgi:hypothetical protein